MGDEPPGGLGQMWDGTVPLSQQDHLTDSAPTGVGAPARGGVRWTPIFSLPVFCRLRAQPLGLGAGSCREGQVRRVGVTVQSCQGADAGSPPSGAPMEDAGKPSSERLEPRAAVLGSFTGGVASPALGSRPVWARAPTARFQALASGSSHHLKLLLLP